MSKISENNYRTVYEIVVTDLLRRTYSKTSFKAEQCQYRNISHKDFTPTTSSPETSGALSTLNDWMIDNSDNIVSACFYGSTVSNCTTCTSVSIPKKDNEYLKNTIIVGPSDVDGLIVINEDSIEHPSFMSDFDIYDSFCTHKGKETKNLLDNVLIVPLGELESSIIFSDRLYPMYYRMLIMAGYWFVDPAGVRDHIMNFSYPNTDAVIRQSFSFYIRRIHALSAFLCALCTNRVELGYVYGTDICPNNPLHQTN